MHCAPTMCGSHKNTIILCLLLVFYKWFKEIWKSENMTNIMYDLQEVFLCVLVNKLIILT